MRGIKLGAMKLHFNLRHHWRFLQLHVQLILGWLQTFSWVIWQNMTLCFCQSLIMPCSFVDILSNKMGDLEASAQVNIHLFINKKLMHSYPCKIQFLHFKNLLITLLNKQANNWFNWWCLEMWYITVFLVWFKTFK